ncbi:MAG: hypothetical protein ACOYKC_00915 [Anaerolineaceae bacterium]|jgi:hypothetical protein
MNDPKRFFQVSGILIILLALVVTIFGVCSFDMSQSYYATNQYGESIQIWGSGIYKHDSYFKVPIFVGSDLTILVFVIPFAIFTFWKTIQKESVEYLIRSFSVIVLLLYYSASVAFGVTYNEMHLIYIALFGLCFFSAGILLAKLFSLGIQRFGDFSYQVTSGMKAFLLISGIALVVAWLPDILSSLVKGTPLELIEVYTTEITYVLDMGLISPLMFLTYFLIRQKSFIGYVLSRMSFMVCIGVGIMLPVQSVFQLLSGYALTIPVIVTKVLIFVLLAGFAFVFDRRLQGFARERKIDETV